MELEVLFEDSNYLLINKPSGLISHGSVDKNRDNLLAQVESSYGKVFLVHRLDRDTSGVICFAKNKDSNNYLSQLFATHQIVKKYLCWCHGNPKESNFEMNDFIKESNHRSEVVKSGGKKALATAQIREIKEQYSLIEVNLKTGRRHQIRCQLAHRGFPIVGDGVYSEIIDKYKGPMLLHCREISFFDTFSQQQITVIAPVSSHFEFFQNKQVSRCIAFYKPFNVLSQFTPEEDHDTLANFNLPEGVYPVGRLDYDSEGLLLLSNDGDFIQKVIGANRKVYKTYHVQVEGVARPEHIKMLTNGVKIQDYVTKPAHVKVITPTYPERSVPIRFRKNIPTSWLEISICEGKNRQVRRMTAAVGLPTLRLIRVKIGKLHLGTLGLGEWREVSASDVL